MQGTTSEVLCIVKYDYYWNMAYSLRRYTEIVSIQLPLGDCRFDLLQTLVKVTNKVLSQRGRTLGIYIFQLWQHFIHIMVSMVLPV